MDLYHPRQTPKPYQAKLLLVQPALHPPPRLPRLVPQAPARQASTPVKPTTLEDAAGLAGTALPPTAQP
jgi:hypothetical protein